MAQGRGSRLKAFLKESEDNSSASSITSHEEGSSNLPKLNFGRGSFLQQKLGCDVKSQLSTSVPETAVLSESEIISKASKLLTGRGRGAVIAKLMSDKSNDPRFLDEASKKLKSDYTSPDKQKTCEIKIDFKKEDVSSKSHDKLTEDVKRLTVTEEKPPTLFRGESGSPSEFGCNFIRLKHKSVDTGFYEYDVRFYPMVVSNKMRYSLLRNESSTLGNTISTFDGKNIFLPKLLKNNETILSSKLPDGSLIEIKITFKRKRNAKDMIKIFNVMFNRIMHCLGLVQMGRNFFDQDNGMMVPHQKLEIWPGYVTSIEEFEDGIMLCCDATNRVLRTQTVLDLLEAIQYKSKQDQNHDWKLEFEDLIIGHHVLTKYNNRHYRIDDIYWDCTPQDSFEKSGEKVTFVKYFKQQYNENITNLQQPMLLSKKVYKLRGKEMPVQLISLVPELCFMTGLTEKMRQDMHLMKDLNMCSRVSPHQRVSALRSFIRKVNDNQEARHFLESWGFELLEDIEHISGRTLVPENIIFNKKTVKGTLKADWGTACTQNDIYFSISIENWAVICPRSVMKTGYDFIDMMKKVIPKMGMSVTQPELIQINNDQTENYINALKRIIDGRLQVAVIFFLNQRIDKYRAVKRLCCLEKAVPSQVILAKTLNKKNPLSIVQKIALQINCKLGGSLWTVDIKTKSTMVVGIDTYHDGSKQNKSVVGIVASMDQNLTQWYSKCCNQDTGLELADSIHNAFIACLAAYRDRQGEFPKQILVFRDGVGDGDLNRCYEYEVPQFLTSCQTIDSSYKPKFLMVIVQKRINAKFFLRSSNYDNPSPGTIIDHTITRRNWQDFFLVSQSVRQGTATPTHYIILYNTTTMTNDQIQRYCYKLTHLYYNWPGTIRVPAPCQYAHTLAYKVGEYLNREAHESLCDKLYYL